MAENDNDIELSVGIKLDESQFTNAYDRILNQVASKTNAVLTEEINKMTGPAAGWGQMPFYNMHDAREGNKYATRTFIASLAEDLKSQGIDTHKSNLEYQGALMNAVYRSTVPDPMDRYHILASQGFLKQADATHPDTALSRAIEADYNLLQQPWARDFVRTKGSGEKKRSYVDFDSMRKYAVDAGLGRWIDPDKEHTADNFELINDELEEIEEKSDETRKVFTGWNDTLKGVLGTLTAIGAITFTAIRATEKAEKMTVQGAGSIDKRRAYVGMSALDELRTKVAGKAVGLGEDAVSSEIYTMSDRIEEYKLLGQGDALPPALLGIFDNLMSSDNPYETYKSSADEIYNQLKGADTDTRKRWLMLMNKAGLGSMSSMIGQFLSNPDYAKTYGTPSQLFQLESNPYYNVYDQQELLTPQIAKLNESLRASYNQMAKDWESTFGVKFKSWWDDVMKDKVVPWFEKFLGYMDPDGGEGTFTDDISDAVFVSRVNKLNRQVADANNPYNITSASDYEKAASWAIGDSDTTITLPSDLGPSSKYGFKTKVGQIREDINTDNPWDFLHALKLITGKTIDNKPVVGSDTPEKNELWLRSWEAQKWLDKTGYISDFSANENTLDDEQHKKLQATTRVLQAYMATGDKQILESYAGASYLSSQGFEYVAKFLSDYADVIRNDTQKQQTVILKLLDPFGKDLAFDVAEDIIGGGFKFQRDQAEASRQ